MQTFWEYMSGVMEPPSHIAAPPAEPPHLNNDGDNNPEDWAKKFVHWMDTDTQVVDRVLDVISPHLRPKNLNDPHAEPPNYDKKSLGQRQGKCLFTSNWAVNISIIKQSDNEILALLRKSPIWSSIIKEQPSKVFNNQRLWGLLFKLLISRKYKIHPILDVISMINSQPELEDMIRHKIALYLQNKYHGEFFEEEVTLQMLPKDQWSRVVVHSLHSDQTDKLTILVRVAFKYDYAPPSWQNSKMR